MESIEMQTEATPSTISRIPATKIVLIRYDQSRKIFELLHSKGSQKFKGAWLAANMAIAEHCQSRVDISDPAAKELLSLAALRILMRLELEGYLK